MDKKKNEILPFWVFDFFYYVVKAVPKTIKKGQKY